MDQHGCRTDYSLEIAVLWCNTGTLGYVRGHAVFRQFGDLRGGIVVPTVAELLAIDWCWVFYLPGWKGWLGSALVAAGTFAVVYRPRQQRKTVSH
jgi:hypothetical protein